MGFLAGLKGFTAAVIGGIGSIPGAMLGGLLVGLTEAYSTGYLPQGSTFQNLYVFALLILIILIEPKRHSRQSRREESLTMPDESLTPGQPPPDQPRIGVDEWVASVEGKRERYSGLVGRFRRVWDALPVGGRLLVFVIPAAIFPLVTTEGNLFRYGLITLLYALLALGLNVVVGFAGLLDLGYIAFFGFGAYMYGILASGHAGRHWPAELAIPVVIAGGALLGLLVGPPVAAPRRGLPRDRHALLRPGVRRLRQQREPDQLPVHRPHRPDRRRERARQHRPAQPLRVDGNDDEGVLLLHSGSRSSLVMTLLYFVNQSRTGRAWRALREDPLAAEVMSMPVNRLKLLAFVFGAAIAGFAGSIYGSVQTGAFPGDFDIGLLITIYAIVILGGAGSLAGVIVAALIVNGVPELLRDPNQAEWVFYVGLSVVVFARVRPWPRLVGVVAGTIGFGFAVHAIADAVGLA